MLHQNPASRRTLLALIAAALPGRLTAKQLNSAASLPQAPAPGAAASPGHPSTFLQAGRAAAVRAVQERLRDTLSALDFVPASLRESVQTGATDSTQFIQAALDYAGALAVALPPFVGYGFVQAGGASVYLPAGRYSVTATLTVPQNVSLAGAGKHSTVIQSSVDGAILRNTGNPSRAGTYDEAGIAIRDLSIVGDRSKARQVGLSFLRLTAATVENIAVEQCGSDGIRLHQCGANTFSNVESVYNRGEGLWIGDGFDRWTSDLPNGLPSNANVFSLFRGIQNGRAGVRLAKETNGNVFFGATCENNYFGNDGSIGCNVHVQSAGYAPNCFYDLWTEGACKSHILIACSDVSALTKLVNWKHFGNGAGGNVGRALIVEGGTAMLDAPCGTSHRYRLQNGSSVPFRIVNKTAGAIYIVNARGSDVAGAALVDDVQGQTTGFFDNLRQDCTAVDGATYGDIVHVGDCRSANGWAVRGDADAHPRLLSRALQRDLLFGDGAAPPDAGLRRTAPRQVGPRPGDYINVGSDWNGSHLVMGPYHLWVDAVGALRIKKGPPGHDLDGAPFKPAA